MNALLAALSNAFGPSGCEADVRQVLMAELQERWDDAHIDSMGNLTVYCGQDLKGPRAMIAAHMDEVGLIIDHIDTKGYLRFKKVGGIDDRVLPSKQVIVGAKRVPGIIGAKPTHLQTKEESAKVTDSDELYIDIGASSRDEAEALVGVGDYATFHSLFNPIGTDLVTGKALDDRVGCYMAATLAKKSVPMPTAFAFTVQEEVGLRGAGAAAYRINPDFALVLEATTCADMPDPESPSRSMILRDGPVLTFQDATSVPHPRLLEQLVDTAEREGIPYQWKETTAGGNDAGSIHKARGGIPTVSLSLPCRYIHTPRAMLAVSDIEHSLHLIEAYLARIAGEGLPF